MRSDCVNECYQDKMRQLCKVDRGLFMSNSLLRKDYLVDGNEKLLSCYDAEFNHNNFSIKKDCEKMCKPECDIKYYPFQIKKATDNGRRIFIRHGEFPDIFIEHIPKMSLMGFVCNFGGLLGMWLGLSLFSILNNSFNLVTNVINQNNNINLKSIIVKVNQTSNQKQRNLVIPRNVSRSHLRPIS